jgi:hypothetical protein
MSIGKGFKRDDQAAIPSAAQSLRKLTGIRAHIQHDVDPMPLQSGLKPTESIAAGPVSANFQAKISDKLPEPVLDPVHALCLSDQPCSTQ